MVHSFACTCRSRHSLYLGLFDCKHARARDSWFKFDDDMVTEVPEKEAVQDNYGGALAITDHPSVKGIQKHHSAYMLTYVRVADAPELLRPVVPEDVPKAVVDGVEEENALREAELVRYCKTNTHTLTHTDTHSHGFIFFHVLHPLNISNVLYTVFSASKCVHASFWYFSRSSRPRKSARPC